MIKLQNGQINLNGKEQSVKTALNPHFLNYKNSWPLIDELFDDCMSDQFRNKYQDSFGNGWIYNWHCVDHVDFELNPRGREIGYHKIFDYVSKIKQTNSQKMVCIFIIILTNDKTRSFMCNKVVRTN